MAVQRQPEYMTVEEWRALERTSHDIKYEYIDGRVYAMAGGSLSHGSIGSNAVRTLQDALRGAGKPCYTYNSDVAARLSSTRYTYPDASVTCHERDRPAPNKKEIQFPRVIVEVLSDTTEVYDKGKKFSYYRACPTVEEYVLVASQYQIVEVYHRMPQSWAYDAYGPGDEIELLSLDIRLPVAALYRDAGVPETIDDPEGEV